MPIIDINPVGSKSLERPSKVTPVYLIVAEDPTVKSNVQKYLAIKIDELTNSIRFVGFETNSNDNELIKNYQDLINGADKLIYKEVQLPLQRVVRIQNLIFKIK